MKNPFSNLFKKNTEKYDDKKLPKKSNINIKSIFEKFLKKRLGNKTKGEDVVGVELSSGEIRLAQISQASSGKWSLDKFYIHPIENLPKDGNITEYPEIVSKQLELAVDNAKITTSNAAVAFAVTSAFI